MPREAYVKNGEGLMDARASINVLKSTLRVVRILAAQWDVTMAEATDMALAQAYEREFGRSIKTKESNGASPRA